MLHLAHSWPQHADLKYWPQAINYAMWVFNHLPNRDSGISPNKLWSGVRTQDDVFRRAHVLAAPFMSLMLHSRMERKFQNGLFALALASSLVSRTSTPLRFLWFSMSKQRRSPHNSTLFLMTLSPLSALYQATNPLTSNGKKSSSLTEIVSRR